MRLLFKYCAVIGILLFHSCKSEHKTGIDWTELTNRYSRNKQDSLKLEALVFLRENMSDLSSEIPVFYRRQTNEIVDIRLDTVSSEAILNKIIKNNDLICKPRVVPNSLLLTTQQIAQTIDSVFSRVNINSWKMKIPKEIIFNNLLPYKAFFEEPKDWRSYFTARFAGHLSKIPTTVRTYSRRRVNDFIDREIIWTDSTHTLRPGHNRTHLARNPGLDELRIIKSGDCNSMATKNTYLYRSLGVPAAVDFTKQYGGDECGFQICLYLLLFLREMVPGILGQKGEQSLCI